MDNDIYNKLIDLIEAKELLKQNRNSIDLLYKIFEEKIDEIYSEGQATNSQEQEEELKRRVDLAYEEYKQALEFVKSRAVETGGEIQTVIDDLRSIDADTVQSVEGEV